MNENVQIEPYAQIIARLLNGEIYETDKIWSDVLEYQIPVSDYFGRIGIEVIVDRRDGFAFLRQMELDDQGKTIGLIKRTQLSYEVTLLLVLLREMLENYELQETESPVCSVTHQHIREELELYFTDTSNKLKLLRQLDRYIKQIQELGFLKEIGTVTQPQDRQYEIRRIIKAKITSDVLEDIRRTMERDAAELGR